MVNLITSCFDCNRGKSDTPLDDLTAVDLQNNEAERLMQQVALNELLAKLRKKKDKQFKQLKEELEQILGFMIENKDLTSLHVFFDRTNIDVILRSARVAATVGSSFSFRWKTFCSQCWKHIKGELQ